MFKRILKGVLIITSSVLVCLWLIFFISVHSDNIIQKENNLDSAYTSLTLPLKITSNREYRQIVKSIDETSRQLNVPYVKRSWYQGHGLGNYRVNYAQTVDDITFEVSNMSHTALQANFDVALEKNKTYSTKRIRNAVQIKKYGRVDFTIKQLRLDEKAPLTREGDFFIQTKNPITMKHFRKLLASKINRNFRQNFEEKEFLPVVAPTSLSSETLSFRQIALVMTFFQVVLILIYCLSLSFELGVHRLLGFSISTTVGKSIAPLIIFGSILSFCGGSFWLLYIEKPDFIVLLSQITIVLTTLELFFSYGIMLILQTIPTNRLLIKRQYSIRVFLSLYLIKGIIFTLILMTALPVGNLAYQYLKLGSAPKGGHYSDYGIFFPTSIGYNQADLVNPKLSNTLDTSIIYPQIVRDGGLLINMPVEQKSTAPQYRATEVNTDYLRFNRIYDKNKKVVSVSADVEKPVVLLPQKNARYASAINRYFVEDLHRSKPIIIPIVNDQKIINQYGNKTTNYSYLSVITLKNMPDMINILTGDGGDPLKVALHGQSPATVYMKYKSLLQKYNAIDNYPQLVRASDINYHVLQQTQGDVIADLFTIGISLIMFLIVALSVIYLYFSVCGRNFSIKQCLGIGIFKSSLMYWALWIAQILIASLFILYSGIEMSAAILILLGAATLIDLLISVIGFSIFSRIAIRSVVYE